MPELHPHEKAIVETFFVKGRKERYFVIRNGPQRNKWLDKLNHSPGLDERYVQWIGGKVDVMALLKSKGAPDKCYVISCSKEIDRREMRLEEALAETKSLGWGTVIGCVPGVLGCYYGERGENRIAVLENARFCDTGPRLSSSGGPGSKREMP